MAVSIKNYLSIIKGCTAVEQIAAFIKFGLRAFEYKVQLENGHIVEAHVSGKIRMN